MPMPHAYIIMMLLHSAHQTLGPTHNLLHILSRQFCHLLPVVFAPRTFGHASVTGRLLFHVCLDFQDESSGPLDFLSAACCKWARSGEDTHLVILPPQPLLCPNIVPTVRVVATLRVLDLAELIMERLLLEWLSPWCITRLLLALLFLLVLLCRFPRFRAQGRRRL
ncbi:hypothetical protein P171DRAFT_247490 [Karstenula rhodostoma CBS 690.94]|uniref:Uncharacterized protein n=1 Tax=Karstenula rhodostoma CBS 690.94 TaxID=1392251 RepID=A0A9P4PQ38_9PLEO|nr:hypothetical protein P171DRAFT_247490 [Karstenula rhodostoma CBS 690.94]